VIFLIIPAELVSLSSTTFRQLLLFIRKTTKTMQQLIFQLVPEHLTYEDELVYPTNRFLNVDLLSLSVYDRLLQRCERMMSRMFFIRGLPKVAHLQTPAFAVARDLDETRFRFSSPTSPEGSIDAIDKHLFIQIAYQFSKCGKWVVAVCCDQRGEAHDVRVWANINEEEDGDGDGNGEVAIVPPNPIKTLVNNVWDFAMDFASKANIEWRVVVSRLGMMEKEELDGKSRAFA
jgi:mediator of RNA polymerase II transcription subunit 13, fungi type